MLPDILTSTVVPVTLKVFPAPTKLSWVIPAPITVPADCIPTAETKLVLTPDNVPVRLAKLPVLAVATPTTDIPAPTCISFLAVIIPIESMFFTSS